MRLAPVFSPVVLAYSTVHISQLPKDNKIIVHLSEKPADSRLS
ncbi:hypothetical protein [Marinilabilia salmonicolor]|nr:hypothetical protein [Marinilabilia salmonicolor]